MSISKVLGLVDDAHPATAKLAENAVVRELLADHDAVELSCRSREVNARNRFAAACKSTPRDH